MDGGKVVFKFIGDDQDLDKKTKGVSSKMSGIAKSIGSAFVKGTAVAGGALIALVGKSVQMAGEIEQQIGGTEAVFGEFASKVQEMSKKAFSTAGLSANDYMATMNKMGALMQGSGIDQQRSLDLSSQAMQRTADVASIMGIDINSAMESIAGAAKGNFTMMDNLGVAMNATTIEAYAMSKGIKKSYNEMSKAEQIEMAMQMFLEKSSYAMGNYAKENETFAGSLQTLKASFSNFMSGVGDIEDVINSVVSFGEILVKSIGNMAPKITSGIVKLINGIVPQIPTLINQLLPSVIDGVVSLVQGISQSLPQIIQTLSGMLPNIITQLAQGIVTIVQTLAQMLPELMPMIVDAIIGIIPLIIDNLPLFLEAGMQMIMGLIEGIMNSVPSLLASIPKILASILAAFGKIFYSILKVGANIIVNLWDGIKQKFNWIISQIKTIVTKIPTAFSSIISKITSVGKNLISGLWNGINDKVQWITNKIKGFGNSVIKSIKGIFGIHSPSTEFAYVGRMNTEGLIEGMKGMEKDVQQTFDGMFDLSPQLYGTSSTHLSPNVNVVVNSNYETDPLGQMVQKVRTFSGGAKNDFNYGYGGA